MKTINFSQFKRMLVITGMAFFSFLLYAENFGQVKGQVLDAKNQPVEYATAVLKTAKTHKFVLGVVCNEKGEYMLKNIKPGKYILSVSMIGYKKNESQNLIVKNNDTNEEKITLYDAPESQNIVVVAKRPSGYLNNPMASR